MTSKQYSGVQSPFLPRAGGEVWIFGFHNDKQTNKQKKKHRREKTKHDNDNNSNHNSIDSYNTSIHYQYTYTPLQNNTHVSKVHCGSAIRFGRDSADYFCTLHQLYAFLLLMHSSCNWRANCVAAYKN